MTARDKGGKVWKSCRVKLEGEEVFAFFPDE
jgi:hypothetical protein